ncbi:acyl-CoA dehydrogenase family protein [Robbsia sp. Bb-Pol-6]|uniref:Dibenzothiophene monooxygenase n=1 Tax=Robbsia betulipollinis TaxID=2981849 RepID=A0ABT3ZHC4_9BURK|nr:acyl-CoA dehydrogenase family protein [Robbsia betulipollinis]MCY0385931.1 acyl-CoA dehydrogenase family protein [Robbsia betulipollinis]
MSRHDFVFSDSVDDARLAARFKPIFDDIAAGAVERDRTRALPYDAVRRLSEAGFGSIRIPVEQGGAGVTLTQLFRLLIELGAADSNLPQILRAHFGFVEDWLNAPPGPDRDAWIARFVLGDIVGGAWTETGDVALGQVATQLTRTPEGWTLSGRKYYSTGTIFADWIDVYARHADPAEGGDVIVAVDTRAAGVTIEDDWDGFGQKTTGSGTTVFDDVRIADSQIIPFERRFKYQTAFYQVFHLATLAGIGRAVERDAARAVRERTRVYSHGNARKVGDDAQIQQVVGEIAAWAFAAQAIALAAAEPLQRAFDAHFAPGHGARDPAQDSTHSPTQDRHAAENLANADAEIASAKGQIAVTELVLRAATHLFDALGASAVGAGKAFDRHWRNARTVSSHNPIVYKSRIVGDRAINGTAPNTVWQIGATPAKA